MRASGVNLALALLWTFLSPTPSLSTFVVGYGLGFGVVAMGQRLFSGANYVGRVSTFLGFAWAFLREFVVSNLALIRVVLFRPRDRIHPGFLLYDVSELTSLEVVILTHCVTLTPGTTTVDVVDEGRTLVLHALDAGDPEAIRRGIDRGLREPLLRWTRA